MKRGRSKSPRSHHEGRGGRRKESHRPPECPSTFRCHQCDANHWTTQCPRILREPHRYPKVDLEHGCYQCGQRGHNPARCPVKRERCGECGGSHNSVHCPFTHVPEEWHEFFDTVRQHVYFCHSESGAVTWEAPQNPMDTIMWHCDACKILLPDELRECVQCHATRPTTVIKSKSDDSSSGGDSEDDSSGDDEEESSTDGGEVDVPLTMMTHPAVETAAVGSPSVAALA